MTTESTGQASRREELSALIDGELGDVRVTEACLHWRADAEARASWHAYQLIGDTLRSDDLCSPPGHDAAFLEALRARLADEPVVLAPQAAHAASLPSSSRGVAGRRGWRAPAAVAAGFVAVVGVVVATRFTAPAPEIAAADAPGLVRPQAAAPRVATAVEGATALAGPAAPVAVTRGLVADGQLIRDVRLDRYLSAHKQFAGLSALGVPSGFLRNATAEAADR